MGRIARYPKFQDSRLGQDDEGGRVMFPCAVEDPEKSGCKELLAEVSKGNIKAIEGGEPIEPTGWVYVSSNGRNTRHGGSESSS